MTCDDIIGDDWLPGILAPEPEEEEHNTIIDPQLTIEKDGTRFIGRFDDDDRTFEITCEPVGTPVRKLRISFTRTHNDGLTTTRYSGRVVSISPRGAVGIIKGKFRRETFREDDRASLVTTGDWETERPT